MVLNDILTGKEFDPYLNYRDMKLDAPLYQVVIYENNIPQMQLSSMGELLSLGEPADQHMDETKIQNQKYHFTEACICPGPVSRGGLLIMTEGISRVPL